jgi:hypothetical protein
VTKGKEPPRSHVDARTDAELSSRRYHEIFDYAPLAHLMVDPDGIIREASFEAERMHDLPCFAQASDRADIVGWS